MAEERVQRRLAAILAADVAGYSRLMGADEEGTLARLKAHRRDIVDSKIEEHRGRIVKTTGDGLLAEFASVVDALRCAVEVQRGMGERNGQVEPEKRIEFRVGINVGDIIIDGSDIYGDGVNVAARLEGLADPGGICVSSRVQEDARGKLDIAFEDRGEQQLKNIAWPMRVYRVHLGGEAATAPLVLPLPDKPSIAVLPFTNMSGDPEREYFSDGITEDIITELSRFRSLFVIARHSSFTFKGKSVTVQQVGRELGVEYVLEGSVRRAGNRVRVTAQLIDARTGAHIWAERLDRDMDDLFAMQDEVTERIVATICRRLEKTELERTARTPPEAMRAHDYVLRARAIISETAETNQQSRALYEKALALEPTNMLALTGIARTYVIDWRSRWGGPEDHAMERAHKLGRQALAVDNTDYRAHLLLGYVQVARRQFAEALMHYQQATALNSNDADGAAHMGELLTALGRFSEALDWFQKAVRLNPLHPAWYLYETGKAYYGARQYEQALAPLRAATNRFPTFITPRRHLAATYAQMGRLDEARAEVATIRKLDPSVCLATYRERSDYERVEDLEHYLDGLRKAGLPE